MKTVAVLPVDDRPANYDYPRYLGRAAGLEVVLPPREWLGNPWRPSRHADLVSWLSRTATTADALVVSIDTLGYGGLIPSRKSSEPAGAVLARLHGLRDIKSARPDLPILASSVILRIHRSDSGEEEKPYWATYGRRLFRLSFLEHKAECGVASPAEAAERDTLRAEIPDAIYADYREGRARNHAVNCAMLDWAQEGIFDYLLLPQDDTADFGWNIAEARRLQASIAERGLAERAITYPGADEIGCLLLARCACQFANFAPRVFPHFSTASGSHVVTDYEDRPLSELLKAHLAPLGGAVVTSPEDADFDLWFNTPTHKQGNSESQWIFQRGGQAMVPSLPAAAQSWVKTVLDGESYRTTSREMEASVLNLELFVRSLLTSLRAGRATAIADVKFVNAADASLCDQLVRHPEIASLIAFGGWNTAGNTLGTVLAQAVIRLIALRSGTTPAQTAAQVEFLLLRFVDDYLYQAGERTRCMVEDLPNHGVMPTMERVPDDVAPFVEAQVRKHLVAAIAPLRESFISSGQVRQVHLTHIHLPWQRLFELGFDVIVELD